MSRAAARSRLRLTVRGLVQGVGFRPFVYALARSVGLSGSVGNTSDGLLIEIEGTPDAVDEFADRLITDAPPLARIDNVVSEDIACSGGLEFEILPSQNTVGRTLVSPDIGTCDRCLAEMCDPADRRYRHPFISCTHCGPRYTVVVDLPYDRPSTTMADLPLCEVCAAEYADPTNRRFHAQTVACRGCGPILTLHRPGGPDLAGDAAIAEARHLLAGGAIVAIKGLGGYHLACDAANQTAVMTLRKRKDRGDKPFAVMVRDRATAESIAEIGDFEAALLVDARRPVVLLTAAQNSAVAAAVAPGRPDLGVVLGYTPVHHLLFGLAGDPAGPQVLVMTSGNLSGEPIVTDDAAALSVLGPIADAWLTHDRPIRIPCDDSVMRVAAGLELPVRRSRGWAPMPIALPVEVRSSIAVGGDLKNTFCVADGRYAWMSAHIGDMDDLATLRAFERATGHLQEITGVVPDVIVADRHPGYRSAAWADRTATATGRSLRRVQHHHAHVAAAMAENGHDGSEPVIGFAFDGTGYGDDGAVWGGELLIADYDGYERAAHLRYVPLPGGDAGVRNPCRMALSHLRAAEIDWDPAIPSVAACSATERSVLARQLATGLGCVPTSSMGRLFDAVSSLAGVCHRIAYEAEAAMLFEAVAQSAIGACGPAYAFALDTVAGTGDVNPGPVISAVAADAVGGVGPAVIAARFHRAVADLVVALAVGARRRTGLRSVALSGGVFLNALLTALCVDQLQHNEFRVLRHRLVPPSDAGLALGQIAVGARMT